MADEKQDWSGPFKVLVRWHLPRGTYGTSITEHPAKDVDHARNLAKKIVRDKGWKIQKVTVWLDDNHCAVWTEATGWSAIRESQRRTRR